MPGIDLLYCDKILNTVCSVNAKQKGGKPAVTP